MNHLDLFSGIGGFSLGLKKVFDIKHTYYSEIDKYAIDVYKNNFNNITYVKSVTDVRGGELPGIDIITFGSPCQDFSMAGKRKGMDGARSSLISEAIRLIEECRPNFFIWENVKGTFSSNNGSDFWAIIQAFTNIGGYRLEWQLLNTKWFLPQNRERIYLVGCLGKGSGKQIFPIKENINNITQKVRKTKRKTKSLQTAHSRTINSRMQFMGSDDTFIKVKSATKKGYQIAKPGDAINYINVNSKIKRGRVGKGVAQTLDSLCLQAVINPEIKITTNNKKGYEIAKPGDTINYQNLSSKTRRGRVGKGIAQTLDTGCNQAVLGAMRSDVILNQSIRRLTPIECERLQGFPDNWTKTGKELGEISDSQRYKMCGNAVTVNVVEAVAKNIKKVLPTKIN